MNDHGHRLLNKYCWGILQRYVLFLRIYENDSLIAQVDSPAYTIGDC